MIRKAFDEVESVAKCIIVFDFSLGGGGLDVFGWCVCCISASGRYLLLVIEHV